MEANVKKPSLLVLVRRTSFDASFVSVTSAPETSAPVSSTILPERLPLRIWACAGGPPAAHKIRSTRPAVPYVQARFIMGTSQDQQSPSVQDGDEDATGR